MKKRLVKAFVAATVQRAVVVVHTVQAVLQKFNKNYGKNNIIH